LKCFKSELQDGLMSSITVERASTPEAFLAWTLPQVTLAAVQEAVCQAQTTPSR
jgi:hypothetical protein